MTSNNSIPTIWRRSGSILEKNKNYKKNTYFSRRITTILSLNLVDNLQYYSNSHISLHYNSKSNIIVSTTKAYRGGGGGELESLLSNCICRKKIFYTPINKNFVFLKKKCFGGKFVWKNFFLIFTNFLWTKNFLKFWKQNFQKKRKMFFFQNNKLFLSKIKSAKLSVFKNQGFRFCHVFTIA